MFRNLDLPDLPFTAADWDNTPPAVQLILLTLMNLEQSTISTQDLEKTPEPVREFLTYQRQMYLDLLKDRRRLIQELKSKYFPGSTFVGPFEKMGDVSGILEEQWLYSVRDLVRGEVLDMSTPKYIHGYVLEQPQVTKVVISELESTKITKGGHSSNTDVIGDFCASSLPVSPNSFDTILCFSILEHCFEPMKMVTNLASTVREGGHILFWTPYAFLDGHHYPDCWRIGGDGYKLMGERAGLELVKQDQFGELGTFYRMIYGYAIDKEFGGRGCPILNCAVFRKPQF